MSFFSCALGAWRADMFAQLAGDVQEYAHIDVHRVLLEEEMSQLACAPGADRGCYALGTAYFLQ